MNVLDMPLVLGQRGDCPPDDLEGELGKAEPLRQLAQDTVAIVARVHERTARTREDERLRV